MSDGRQQPLPASIGPYTVDRVLGRVGRARLARFGAIAWRHRGESRWAGGSLPIGSRSDTGRSRAAESVSFAWLATLSFSGLQWSPGLAWDWGR